MPALAPLLLLLLPGLSLGLFEDQAFKFDWRKPLVGNARSARFWETSTESALILVSESNSDSVLSSVDSDSGELRWRHVMASGEDLLDAEVTGRSAVATLSRNPPSSSSGLTVRIWNPQTGALVHEGAIAMEDQQAVSEHSFISGNEANVVTVDEATGQIKIRVFDLKKSEEETRSATFSTGIAGGERIDCDNTKTAFVCFSASNRMVYSASLPVQAKAAFVTMKLSDLGLAGDATPRDLTAVAGSKDLVRITLKNGDHSEDVMILKIVDGKVSGSHVFKGKDATKKVVSRVTGCKNTDDILHLQQTCLDDLCYSVDKTMKITKVKDLKKDVHSVDFTSNQPVDLIDQAWASCEEDDDQKSTVYQLVILSLDGSLTSLTPLANVMWTREESLASISKVELVSTGLKDDDGTYDSESSGVNQGEAMDLVDQFLRRIKHHFSLLNGAFTHLLEIRDLRQLIIGEPDANFDEFGLRKIIVAVTGRGKVIGLDSITGSIIWRLVFPGDDSGEKYLFVQRSALHFGYEAQCALIYKNRNTGAPEMLTFNPLTGHVRDKRSINAGFTHAILLHQTDDEHLRPILLLSGKVEVEPRSTKLLETVSGKTFIVSKDKKTMTVLGQRLLVDGASGEIKLVPVWTLANPSTDSVTITAKSSEEKVHSQGRVMADRSVLFKYVNPNLGLVMAEGRDSTGKNYINVYLVDLVTGRVVFSANHKRVVGPYHVVHSENWAVYTYYNEKARRAEMTSIELFEGHVQSNTSVFSSLSDSVSPLVERQSFILGPSHISALQDTVTEKGITSKNILVATATGAVYNIPRHFIDPRRPNMNTPPEMREPGLPPYIPELQLPHEFIMNYNQTIAQPRGISTGATGLESTSVVFVYGLDLYCTRIAPSKAFDLLKDDFDYYVISGVLFLLVAASYVTKRLSQRKSLKQAWR